LVNRVNKSRRKSRPRAIDPALPREVTSLDDGRAQESVRDRLLTIAHGLRDRAIEMEVSLEDGRGSLARRDVLDLAALYRDDADFLDELAGGRGHSNGDHPER
jgi:hypothetical protein